MAGIELGVLYYHGTTQWGWSIALPQKSVVLTKLSELPNVLLIGGELQNLTIRANLSTATPYLGFAHAYPNKQMVAWEQLFLRGSLGTNISGRGWDVHKRWLRRWQVSHLVGHGRSPIGMGKELGHWREHGAGCDRLSSPDRASGSRLVDHRVGGTVSRGTGRDPSPDDYRSRDLDEPSIPFRRSRPGLVSRPGQGPQPSRCSVRRLISWDDTVATVEHDGACDLVLARSYYPGWRSRIDEGPEQPVLSADGGFQAVRINGSGTHRVALRYQPTGIVLLASISILSGSVALGVLAAAILSSLRGGVFKPVTD